MHSSSSSGRLLQQIDCWLFDLDNTLYPPALALFDQIDERMGAFIMRTMGCEAVEARAIQKRYFHDHGTTLAGMIRHHDVCPETFLSFVHDVDFEHVPRDEQLRDALAALPGKRHIFTNADADYAAKLLEKRGLSDLFDSIVDIRATDYAPKPDHLAYQHLSRLIDGFDPSRTLFVDDMSRNLPPAHAMGITTVWLDNGSESGNRGHNPCHVDHHIDDLTEWLMAITTSPSPS
jgi:putative hydrolase of the HAD superfamily